MKVLICGKGGSGKSTVTALLAKALSGNGKSVLVVDADESNLCLHRLLGVALPGIVMDAMGGRKGVKAQLNPSGPTDPQDAFLKDHLTLADIPSGCLAEANGVKLLVVGKIASFGEGCACMIGNISKAILNRLHDSENEVVLVDAEAGLEHFGRRVNAGSDLILCIIDPSFESFALAEKVNQMAESAGIQVAYILNKMEDAVRESVAGRLKEMSVIAALPKNEAIFMQSLMGEALSTAIPEIQDVCKFIDGFKKPVSLAVL